MLKVVASHAPLRPAGLRPALGLLGHTLALCSLHPFPSHRQCQTSAHKHPLPAHTLSSSSSSSAPPSPPANDKDYDIDRQNKNANLGHTIESLKRLVPLITARSLPKSLISPNVLLRVCPTHFEEFNSYLPVIKGHLPYYTGCKLLQFLVSTIVLTPSVPLHIHSIRTHSINDKAFPYYGVYSDSTKIIVRWSTSTESVHADDVSDTGKLSLLKGWSKVATTRFGTAQHHPSAVHKNSISAAISDLTVQLRRLAKDKRNNLDRVVSGIFIFELSADNDKIIVHTVEDIDILEKTESDTVPTLRVC